MCDPTIDYIAAPPGLGKTQAAINYMITHIKRGAADELEASKPQYIFYVYPSNELGKQTLQNLLSQLPQNLHHYLFRIAGERVSAKNRTNTEQQVANILNNRGRAKKTGHAVDRCYVPGCVIFMTHATFLKLRKHETFEQTIAIFDESTSWVMPIRNTDLKSEAHQDHFNALFTEEPLMVNSVPHASLKILKPRRVAENRKAKLWPGKPTESVVALNALHTQLTAKEDEYIRMRVFSFRRGGRLIQVTMPYYPFKGFRNVLILAADFTRTQMFYLLKSEGAKMRNSTKVFIDRYGARKYWDAFRIITERSARLHIVPLLPESNMGSKHQYQTGLLVPEARITELQRLMDKLNLSTTALHEVVQCIRSPATFHAMLGAQHLKVLEFMQAAGVQTDILAWQLKRAQQVVRKWKAKYPCDHNAVLFVNKDYESQTRIQGFDYLSIGQVEGKNEFQNSNAVVFLAAVNPDKDVATLLSALCGDGYDADEDFVVSKAVQCIGRGNIRNHKSKAPMLAVVATEGLAEKIRARMEDVPKVVYSNRTDPNHIYRVWSHHKAKSMAANEKGDKKTRNREAQNKYKENPFNKELSGLRAKRSRLTKYVARVDITATKRREWRAELQSVEAAIKVAEKNRMKWKSENS
jgi:hypothetical protein